MNQLKRLVSYVESAAITEQDSTLLLGDFNFPKTIGPISTKPHKLLKSLGFMDLMKRDSLHTWPSDSSKQAKSFPYKIKIDHAYGLQNVQSETACILPLQGSDHYPVYCRLR